MYNKYCYLILHVNNSSINDNRNVFNDYNTFGEILRQKSNFIEADAVFGKALELRPDFVAAVYNSGLVAMDLKNFTKAIQMIKILGI